MTNHVAIIKYYLLKFYESDSVPAWRFRSEYVAEALEALDIEPDAEGYYLIKQANNQRLYSNSTHEVMSYLAENDNEWLEFMVAEMEDQG